MIVFLYTIRRPPRLNLILTLFPYTTLFRSKTIAGWTSTSGAKPCLWIDGVYTALDTPEVDDQGLKPQWVKAEQISADASVVTGIIRANVGYYTLGTIWRAPEYKAEMLFNDSLAINGGTWDFYTILNVSANSEWICGGVALPNPSDATTYIVYPYRYNLKTETIEIVKEVEAFPGLGDGGAVAIDDNGTLYSPCDAGNPWERDSYIIPVGSSAINTFDYLEQEFEDTTLLNSEVVTTGVCAATPDGSVICGNGSTLEANLAWVVYKKEALSVNSVSTERNSIYLNGNTVYGVNGLVEIFNISGSKVYSANAANGTVSVSTLSKGIYIVTNNGAASKIVRN